MHWTGMKLLANQEFACLLNMMRRLFGTNVELA